MTNRCSGLTTKGLRCALNVKNGDYCRHHLSQSNNTTVSNNTFPSSSSTSSSSTSSSSTSSSNIREIKKRKCKEKSIKIDKKIDIDKDIDKNIATEECSICYNDDVLQYFTCTHSMCKTCILQMKNTVCPFCRTDFSLDLQKSQKSAIDINQAKEEEIKRQQRLQYDARMAASLQNAPSPWLTDMLTRYGITIPSLNPVAQPVVQRTQRSVPQPVQQPVIQRSILPSIIQPSAPQRVPSAPQRVSSVQTSVPQTLSSSASVSSSRPSTRSSIQSSSNITRSSAPSQPQISTVQTRVVPRSSDNDYLISQYARLFNDTDNDIQTAIMISLNEH